MAQIKFNYLFLATTALLLIVPFASGRSFIGVNPFCRTSDYRKMCTKMVKNATTWEEASINAVSATLALAKHVQAMAPSLKFALIDFDPTDQVSIFKTCQDNFESKVEDIEISFNALKNANDTGTAHTRLGAAVSNDSCKDILKEIGAENPLEKPMGYLSRFIDNSLAVVLQI